MTPKLYVNKQNGDFQRTLKYAPFRRSSFKETFFEWALSYISINLLRGFLRQKRLASRLLFVRLIWQLYISSKADPVSDHYILTTRAIGFCSFLSSTKFNEWVIYITLAPPSLGRFGVWSHHWPLQEIIMPSPQRPSAVVLAPYRAAIFYCPLSIYITLAPLSPAGLVY